MGYLSHSSSKIALMGILLFTCGCGGGGGGNDQISANSTFSVRINSPSGTTTISKGGIVNFQATVTGGTSPYTFLWDFAGGAANSTLQNPGSIAFNSSGSYSVTLTVNDAAGNTTTSTPVVIVVHSSQNVQPIAVDGGPISSTFYYPNAAFTSVTVCIPGTSNCQTIDGVLVDTGSYGLRLLSSAISLSLPSLTINGNSVGECIQFVDGSHMWGPVKTADVMLAGEVANSVPIHVLNHNFYTIPSDCQSGGGPEEDTLQTLGANGILGVGQFQQDCGSACTSASGGSPPAGSYYGCSSTGCRPIFVSLSQQVQNPVVLFSDDTNGVIIDLPAVTGAKASVNGSMIFGIGTQTNNTLDGTTVLTLNSNLAMTTIYKNHSLPYSFIDSGSNGYFFSDNSIPHTADSGFYIPFITLNLSAINQGENGSRSTVAFSVDNANNLFNSPSTNGDFVFGNLAGPISVSGCFDWGLPFFYGRRVFTAIEGMDTPTGPGPFWAY